MRGEPVENDPKLCVRLFWIGLGGGFGGGGFGGVGLGGGDGKGGRGGGEGGGLGGGGLGQVPEMAYVTDAEHVPKHRAVMLTAMLARPPLVYVKSESKPFPKEHVKLSSLYATANEPTNSSRIESPVDEDEHVDTDNVWPTHKDAVHGASGDRSEYEPHVPTNGGGVGAKTGAGGFGGLGLGGGGGGLGGAGGIGGGDTQLAAPMMR